jgi:mRNA-degrading endonuclease RelE of RelBE toxin-antitoxin system
MRYQVETTARFDKRLKRLTKKYLSILKDVDNLVDMLKEAPHTGILLQENVYKIRMAITSTNKGKSGGARVITYVVDEQEKVTLIDIYSKSDQDNISDSQIQDLIDELND